jgi:hypothetical protein
LGKSAYITFVEGSTVQQVSLNDVKEMLNQYIVRAKKTAEQIDYPYEEVAFPYTIEEKPEAQGKWFYLKGTNPKLYKYILFGVGSRPTEDGSEQHFIQVTLTDFSTAGDKGKANEFCKYLAKHYKAELTLFNSRKMYFNPRK